MFLLDSDTLTHLHANHTRVLENVNSCIDPEVGTTVITRIEILRGRFEYLLKADTTEQFLHAQRYWFESEARLNNTFVVKLDRGALEHFQALRQLKGLRKIGRTDQLIASISLANNATLVTRNTKHFKLVPKLKIANWVD